jgi:4-hydroxy-tetrahydrodipicolinate synthase
VSEPRFLSAIATPFGDGGAVDLRAFEAHIGWLADAGLDGVFVAGTTGEGVLLEDDEVAALVERAAARDDLRVVAQVGRPSTRATVRLAQRAIELGADAVAAYVPWFYPATDADVRGHFLALLEAAGDVPAFLYNIPRRTVNDLSAELLAELAAAGFAGMKDSTGDFDRHEAYLDALHGRRFELYVGSEPLVLRAYRRGAAGAVTGLAGCRPELFAALREALSAGDDGAAERVQAEITAAKEEVESEGSTVAAVKRRVAAALAERGVDYPPAPRPPFG